jgi:hypothetical protein
VTECCLHCRPRPPDDAVGDATYLQRRGHAAPDRPCCSEQADLVHYQHSSVTPAPSCERPDTVMLLPQTVRYRDNGQTKTVRDRGGGMGKILEVLLTLVVQSVLQALLTRHTSSAASARGRSRRHVVTAADSARRRLANPPLHRQPRA